MKNIAWSKILSVGFEEIDEDHRKLVGIFNELNQAVADGAAADYLAATLDELINCTVWHFSHEERLMLKYRYGGIENHKVEHRELIESARELQQQVLRADQGMASDQIAFLERWLTGHILTTDQKLGAFLSQVS